MAAQPDEVTTAVQLRAAAAVATSPSEITGMLQLALEKGVDVGTLERLVALHERVTDRANAAEFAEAKAAFQAACPPITHNRSAKITTRAGGSYGYTYADLTHIAAIVNPILREFGLSYSWNSKLTGGWLAVTCILKHINGHEEPTLFEVPVESSSGMSEQQKHGAAYMFGRRNSLVAALGITTADPDNDGGNPALVSREQAEELRRLADELGADVPKLMKFLGYATFEEIRADDYNRASHALEAKRRENEKKKGAR